MHIGIDITALAGARTGVGHYVAQLLYHLLKMEQGPVISGFSSGLRRGDVTVGGLKKHCHLPVPTRLLYQSWGCLGAPRVDGLLKGIDLFHGANYVVPPVRQAKRVLSLHDLSFLKCPQWASPRIVGFFSRNVGAFARAADAVVTGSEASKSDIVQLLAVAPEKITVTPYGVNRLCQPAPREKAMALLRKHYALDGPFLLFVGTLEPRKNIETLINVFAELAKALPHKLVLAGVRGWRMNHLDDLIKQCGVADRVVLTGYVAAAHLPALYSGADLFLYPSHYEGFGLPVLEAMACGCPVVSSDAGALVEVGGDAACYAGPQEPQQWVEAIRGLMSDATARNTMRERGFLQARKFSWAACAEKTLQVYKGVLG